MRPTDRVSADVLCHTEDSHGCGSLEHYEVGKKGFERRDLPPSVDPSGNDMCVGPMSVWDQVSSPLGPHTSGMFFHPIRTSRKGSDRTFSGLRVYGRRYGYSGPFYQRWSERFKIDFSRVRQGYTRRTITISVVSIEETVMACLPFTVRDRWCPRPTLFTSDTSIYQMTKSPETWKRLGRPTTRRLSNSTKSIFCPSGGVVVNLREQKEGIVSTHSYVRVVGGLEDPEEKPWRNCSTGVSKVPSFGRCNVKNLMNKHLLNSRPWQWNVTKDRIVDHISSTSYLLHKQINITNSSFPETGY